MKNLEVFNSIRFRGENHFEDDRTQNWLVFQPIQRYFKTISANKSNILSWKSKRLSNESIKPPTTSNKTFNPSIDFVGTQVRSKFNEDCLKQEKIAFNHGKIVNIYIVYEIEGSVNISRYATLENCLFGAVKLPRHVDVNLYKYSGYSIGFDRKESYSTGGKVGRNVITIGVNMRLSPQIDNKKKIYFVTVEKRYSVNPNQAGLFEGSFSCGRVGGVGEWGEFDPPSYFKKNLSNFNITLYSC